MLRYVKLGWMQQHLGYVKLGWMQQHLGYVKLGWMQQHLGHLLKPEWGGSGKLSCKIRSNVKSVCILVKSPHMKKEIVM